MHFGIFRMKIRAVKARKRFADDFKLGFAVGLVAAGVILLIILTFL